jgi:hypothetical protein
MSSYQLSTLFLLVFATTARPQSPTRWRVSERPVLSLGLRDAQGPELFGAVAGATRLSSGVVVVADRASLELRYFSPGGEHLRTVGRKGGGPGEFQSMAKLQRCAGDSVFVYDVALFRMSIFAPDGRYVRAGNLRKWLADGMTPYDFWCNPAGTLAFANRTLEAFDIPPQEGPLRPEVDVILVGPHDSIVTLGRFAATEMYFKAPNAGPRPLGRRTTVGVGSQTVYVGTGDSYEVLAFSARGSRLHTLREPRSSLSVTSAQVTQYVEDYTASQRGRANTAAYEEYFRSLKWPSSYPAYARLLVDWTDNLWIEDYPVPGQDIRTWSIYAPSGTQVATIELPKNFQLLEAGKDYVLGIWRDEDGVQYVREYAFAH